MDFVHLTQSREEKRRTLRRALGWAGVSSPFVAQAPVLMVGAGLSGWGLIGSLELAIAGAGAMTAALVSIPAAGVEKRRRARKERIRTDFNEYYDLSLSVDQFNALGYPDTDPGPGFQTFGSIKLQDQVDGVNFVERMIYLTASDGELKLTESRDGKRFKELKPSRQALEGSTSSSIPVESAAVPLSISA